MTSVFLAEHVRGVLLLGTPTIAVSSQQLFGPALFSASHY